jgi:alkaline phosphatase D
MRRTFPRSCLLPTAGVFFLVIGNTASPAGKPVAGPRAGMGILVGEVTPHSALVQVRLTTTDKLVNGDVPGAAGIVEFTLRAIGSEESLFPLPPPGSKGMTQKQTATAGQERDFIARAVFSKLTAGTVYRCTTRIGRNKSTLKPGPTATFRTLPGSKIEAEVRFVVVTGMNYAKFHGDDRIDRKLHKINNNTDLPKPYSGPDKHLGYPALASILKKKPHFFVGTGDNVYYDTPVKGRAQTVAQMRRKWHAQFVQPRYRDLFAAVPTYWEIDDHDYRRDDCDNSGNYKPSPATGKKLMLEQLPYGAAGDDGVKTYRTHRLSRDLQVWFTEGRLYRSPNAMPDGPKKTIWGAAQKAWLKRTLKESDATFKLLISPTPLVGPDDLRKKDNHTNIGGFRHEGDEFFRWLKVNGFDRKGFYLVCGDRHWQYRARHPSGIEEFSCGALVDANSRLGRKPGDSKSTDPKGLIKQIYAQKRRGGGFLLITSRPATNGRRATLTFTFHDVKGNVLYNHTK